MAWLILVTSGVLEAVWAVSLGESDGLTRLAPSLIFAFTYVLSMIGLSWAMRKIPISIAYTVWIGIGAAGAVVYSMSTGAEPVELWRIVFLTGIICAIVGLKMTSSKPNPQRQNSGSETTPAG